MEMHVLKGKEIQLPLELDLETLIPPIYIKFSGRGQILKIDNYI